MNYTHPETRRRNDVRRAWAWRNAALCLLALPVRWRMDICRWDGAILQTVHRWLPACTGWRTRLR